MSLDRTFQIHAAAPKHSVTCSQHYKTHPNIPLIRTVCVYRLPHEEIRSFKFTLLAAKTVSQVDSDKEQVNVTKITDTLCKVKIKLIVF